MPTKICILSCFVLFDVGVILGALEEYAVLLYAAIMYASIACMLDVFNPAEKDTPSNYSLAAASNSLYVR